jgi:hypothetical protein
MQRCSVGTGHPTKPVLRCGVIVLKEAQQTNWHAIMTSLVLRCFVTQDADVVGESCCHYLIAGVGCIGGRALDCCAPPWLIPSSQGTTTQAEATVGGGALRGSDQPVLLAPAAVVAWKLVGDGGLGVR